LHTAVASGVRRLGATIPLEARRLGAKHMEVEICAKRSRARNCDVIRLVACASSMAEGWFAVFLIANEELSGQPGGVGGARIVQT